MQPLNLKSWACVLVVSASGLSNGVFAADCDDGVYRTYQNQDTLGWDEVYADLYTDLLVGSTCDDISLGASGSAGVTLFSKRFEIASTQVNALINSENKKQLSSSTLVLGFEVDNQQLEHLGALEFSETPSFPIDVGGQYGFDLGVVALTLHYGLMGEVNATISAQLSGLNVKTALAPHVETDAYLSGSLGFLAVGSTVNILDDTLTITGEASHVIEQETMGVSVRGVIENQVSSLGGNVYLEIFGNQTDIFKWDGFGDKSVLLDESETIYF